MWKPVQLTSLGPSPELTRVLCRYKREHWGIFQNWCLRPHSLEGLGEGLVGSAICSMLDLTLVPGDALLVGRVKRSAVCSTHKLEVLCPPWRWADVRQCESSSSRPGSCMVYRHSTDPRVDSTFWKALVSNLCCPSCLFFYLGMVVGYLESILNIPPAQNPEKNIGAWIPAFSLGQRSGRCLEEVLLTQRPEGQIIAGEQGTMCTKAERGGGGW